jgi:hypothetical protein
MKPSEPAALNAPIAVARICAGASSTVISIEGTNITAAETPSPNISATSASGGHQPRLAVPTP